MCTVEFDWILFHICEFGDKCMTDRSVTSVFVSLSWFLFSSSRRYRFLPSSRKELESPRIRSPRSEIHSVSFWYNVSNIDVDSIPCPAAACIVDKIPPSSLLSLFSNVWSCSSNHSTANGCGVLVVVRRIDFDMDGSWINSFQSKTVFPSWTVAVLSVSVSVSVSVPVSFGSWSTSDPTKLVGENCDDVLKYTFIANSSERGFHNGRTACAGSVSIISRRSCSLILDNGYINRYRLYSAMSTYPSMNTVATHDDEMNFEETEGDNAIFVFVVCFSVSLGGTGSGDGAGCDFVMVA
mmetsp:Transcript_26584/g.63363  ORF Transcript_26584/g.63363 Transcript_26584/m.63363 type:complete len:295 (-) Transcript_26584:6-890(-)